jgi:hypothetical protein
MHQYRNLAINALMEPIRQPIFLRRLTGFVFCEIFLAVRPGCAGGDELPSVSSRVLV